MNCGGSSTLLRYLLGVLLVACFANVAAMAADEANNPPRLSLHNGDYYDGRLVDSDRPGVLHWQSIVTATPFLFPIDRVNVVHFPRINDGAGEEAAEPADNLFAVYTTAGEILHGSLLSVSDDIVEIETTQFGRLQLHRANVRQIVRIGEGNRMLYLGPDGLDGWLTEDQEPGWHEEVGQLVTDKPTACLNKILPVADSIRIELAASWTKKAEFSVELGNLFSIESWGDKLVVVRMKKKAADLGTITTLAAGAGQIHLQVFVDQIKGHVSVCTLEGQLLASITVPGETETSICVSLTNFDGDFRLEHLAVSEWTGRLPTEHNSDRPFVEKTDRDVVEGDTLSLVENSDLVSIADGELSREIPLAEVFTITLRNGPEPYDSPLRVSLQDGVRLVGQLLKVNGGKLQWSSPSVITELAIPTDRLRSMVSLQKVQDDFDFGYVPTRFEAEGIRSHGRLEDAVAKDELGPFVWRPAGSENSAQLHRGVSGRIVYHERPQAKPEPKDEAQTQREVQAQGFIGGVFRVFGGGMAREHSAPSDKPVRPRAVKGDVLVLRYGDRLPCEVEAIDETHIRFTSDYVTATALPLDRLKAWETTTESGLDLLDEAKRRRLLTLPRMQRNNPPTHLIESTTGDFLRGRVLGVDENVLYVELRLETKEIPRDRIRRVVWLDKEAMDETETETEITGSEPSQSDNTNLVLAIHANGVRLSFVPKSVKDGIVSGENDVLGACRVKLERVDELRMGETIAEAAAEVVSRDWQLLPAVDPRFVTDDGTPTGGGSPGADAALVGSPAPDFKLKLLDGADFQLSDAKGKIVVLDFWATWCGPCIQAMPQVDRVTREFEDRGVQFIAVNMQEDAESIKSLLERLELDPTVALDIDGATAEKYGVTAIPQTVIVNREGKVARLFIGGGGTFEAQLREALEQVAGDAAAE